MATRKTKARPAARKPAARKPAVRKPAAKRVAAKKKAAPRAAPKPAMDLATLGGIGSEAVLKATGKAWAEWLKVLDRAGAVKMPHKEIAALVYDKYDIPGWWAQMVTVGYEQARGLRALNQKADGYVANASKTYAANLERLYTAWHDPRLREFWLPGAPLEVRRSTDGKSMRVTWTLGNSSVDVNFYSKGRDKSMVQVQHSKLSDAAAVAAQKAYWTEGLERLRAWLEGPR